jgi:superfamily II DNA or RNA helicase
MADCSLRMSLRNLPTDPHLATSTAKLLDCFYVPALKASMSYDRGVGYFTSNWLRLAAAGLAGLAANGGRARIIASPMLAAEDCAALSQGSEARDDPALKHALEKAITDLEAELNSDTLSALAWMIADNLLDFRIAIPTAALDGDFHDKFGVMQDINGDAIAFHGSPNDSERAFRNYESISIYYSWIDEREAMRVQAEKDRFDHLWNNGDINVRIYKLPDAVRRNLIAFTAKFPRPYAPPPSGLNSSSARWTHQQDAAGAFFNAKRGVLEMATGTGKTRTALTILEELRERNLVQSAMIVAYGTDLLDQWHRELVLRTDLPVYRDYASHREGLGFLNAPANAVLLQSRTNLAPLLSRLPTDIQRQTLIVFDEVHGMGSTALVEALDGKLNHFEYRLGLSATPERAYDAAGNAFVASSIGPIIFRFTLEQAIERGILCEFDYVPLEYEFSDEDREAVKRAIKRHHAKARSAQPVPIEQLYTELARIRKLSKEKLMPFRNWIEQRREALHRSLIFVETAEYGHLVQDILMLLGIDFHTYYGDDSRANLKRFADGELECLVTCKRISEGIDISSIRTVILFASSRARLETTQRLGRCLRVDPQDSAKRPLVVDFIRTDDLSGEEGDPESTADLDRRNWLNALSSVRTEARL